MKGSLSERIQELTLGHIDNGLRCVAFLKKEGNEKNIFKISAVTSVWLQVIDINVYDIY